MAVVIKPFTKGLILALKDFNHRLIAGGVGIEFQFPESPTPCWLPKLDQRRIYQEFFLAVENTFVRGGYVLKYQDFSFSGEIRSVGYYHHPISEGLVSKTYVGVGAQMLKSALKAQPLLFALGMRDYDQALPRMLKVMGWDMWSVPFYFRVNNASRFLRQIQPLRKTMPRRLLMDFAAVTGTGWLAFKLLHGFRAARKVIKNSVSVEIVSGFSGWADDLWEECRTRYAMVAVRDSQTLKILYPSTNKKFIGLKFTRSGAVVGWVVLLNTPMRDDRYFGNLRVGSIADCLALPENTASVIREATKVLEEMEVDLIVSNQSHTSWCSALKAAGFQRGPSNFIFAASKKLSELLHPFEARKTQIHLNRGDGDGPIHL